MSDTKKSVFISVIVPVYKVEKYLRQCVDSILNQKFDDFELILINDGSPDGSPAICDEYAKNDKRVHVIHQENGGQTKARKAGLMAANGEYVWFVDSDDWLADGALQTACECAKQNDCDIVTFDSTFNYSHSVSPVKQPVPSGVFDQHGMIKNIYPKMIYSGRFFYFGIYAAMWNKIFRKSLLLPNMVNVDERIRIGEDGVTTFASFLDAKKICVLGGKYLYNYRDNNVSITRSYCREQFDNALLLIDALRAVNKNKNVYDLSDQIEYYFMYNIRSIFNEEFYYRYKKNYVARYKYLKKIALDKSVCESVAKISVDGMSKDQKRFFGLLKSGKYNLLILHTIKVAYIMRLKLQIRKILKKY